MVTRNRIGYACLLGGLAVIIPSYRWWVLENTDWRPLAVPYPLHPTTLAPAEFAIDRDGVYEIVLKITPPRDETKRDLADCLMGWDRGNPKWGLSAHGRPCQVAPAVALSWRLIPLDGRPPESGVIEGIADGGGFSIDEADRKLTAFSAERGQRYRFEGQTSSDAGSLAFVQPRIVVQPTGMTNENEIVTTLAYWVAAGVAGLAGLALLVKDLWASSRPAV